MTKKKGTEELVSKHNSFVESIELDNIAMEAVDGTVNRENYNEVIDEHSRNNLAESVSVNYDLSKDFDYNNDANFLFVYADYGLRAKSPVDRRKVIFSIKCKFLVQYETPKTMTDDIFEPFTEHVVQLNVWPYFRNRAHNITQWLGIQELVLPIQPG